MNSRSMQRRKAAMKGEDPPDFSRCAKCRTQIEAETQLQCYQDLRFILCSEITYYDTNFLIKIRDELKKKWRIK